LQFPELPDVPPKLPITHSLVESLRLLKLDDDYGTLDLYVAAAEIKIVTAMRDLEQRITQLEG
jgi:hypothetical protein